MPVLSIDCGLKNLAYCILETNPCKLVHWEVFDVCPKTFEDLPCALVEALDARKDIWSKADTVLIERQPTRNRKMSVVQHVLHSYFLIRGKIDLKTVKTIRVVSAFHKLGSEGGKVTGKTNYRNRKKMSVEIAKEFLQTQDEPMRTYFESCSKKDDLADCLNQAIQCSKRGVDAFEPTVAKETIHTKENTRPRKPTEKQLKRGLSASNVVWHLSQPDFETVYPKNKGLQKAVQKWFGNLETLRERFAVS